MGRPRLATSDLHVRISNLIQKGLFMGTWSKIFSKELTKLRFKISLSFFFRRMQHCSTLLTACYSSCRVKIIISSMSDNLKFLLFSSFICNNFFIVTRIHGSIIWNIAWALLMYMFIRHAFIYGRHQKDTHGNLQWPIKC